MTIAAVTATRTPQPKVRRVLPAARERLRAFVAGSELISHCDRSFSVRGRSCRERCSGQAKKIYVAARVFAPRAASR